MRKGFAVFCLDHRFHIEVVNRYNPQFKRGRRRRIKGLEVCEQIAQRIAHRLEDEGCRVVLRAVEVLTCKLADACADSFVEPSLLEPPGIEAGRIHARHAARTGQQAQISSEITSSLPERRRMEKQIVLAYQLAKIDVDCPSEAVPARESFFLVALDVP